jgi:phosphoesterase RecJ-like protein
LIKLSDFAKKLKSEKDVGIITHVRPDGDAIGSALGLSLALTSLGIKNAVYCDDVIPKKFSYLNGFENIKNTISNHDAYIAVDCADQMRLGSFEEIFIKAKSTYNLDHHATNDRYAKLNYVVDTASNCENVYALAVELGAKIDKDTANCLMTGLVTDTGNFRHKNVTDETLKTASELLKCGADLNGIVYKNFNEQSKERAKLFGKVMSRIRYFYDDKIAVITIFDKDLLETGAMANETEGFVDFITGISGVEVSVCLMETAQDTFKASLRARRTDVSEVASVFGGGGHVLASGCKIHGEYEEVVDRLVGVIKRYIPE